jgi:hypothetical protein
MDYGAACIIKGECVQARRAGSNLRGFHEGQWGT